MALCSSPLSFLSRIYHNFTVISCCNIYRNPRYWIEGSSSCMTASCFPKQAPSANLLTCRRVATRTARSAAPNCEPWSSRTEVHIAWRITRGLHCVEGVHLEGRDESVCLAGRQAGTCKNSLVATSARSLSHSLSLGYAPDRRHRQGAGGVRNCDRSLRC